MLLLSGLQRRPTAVFSTALLALVLAFGWLFDNLADRLHRPQVEPGAAMALHLAQWVTANGDAGGLPFVVVDKAQARIHRFDGEGRLQASGSVLLSALQVDDPALAATPAGRFVAHPDLLHGGGLAWYGRNGELLLHGPQSGQAPGRAAYRLASLDTSDRRISDGSLHVEAGFYQQHLQALRGRPSVAYVLPEQLGMDEVFGGAGAQHALSGPHGLPSPSRTPL